MTTPVRELIIADRLAALVTAAETLSTAIERNRLDQHGRDELPAWVLWDGGHQVEDGDTGGTLRAMTLDVEVRVAAAGGAALGTLLSTHTAAVIKAMRNDLTCGGNAWDVREVDMTDPEFTREQGHGLVAECSLRFTVHYQTAEFDPSLPS